MQALELANITELADKPPYNLSLGQKKRVAIAGVLAMQPELLIFDETFSFIAALFHYLFPEL